MKRAQAAMLLIAGALFAAEVVRPTTIPAKHLSHPNLTSSEGPLPFTQEQLDDLPPIVTPALGNIDAVRALVRGRTGPLPPGGRLAASDTLLVGGWCADPEAARPGAGLIALVDGSRRINVSDGYGGIRDDVSRLYASRTMDRVGFDVRLPAAQLGAGTHVLRLAVVARSGAGIFILPTPETVFVGP